MVEESDFRELDGRMERFVQACGVGIWGARLRVIPMSERSEALEQAHAAIKARMAGDIIERVSIAGETDHRVSSSGSVTQRVSWPAAVEVRPYGRAPVRFAGEDFEAFAAVRLAQLLVDRVVIVDGEGYEFERVWRSLESEYAEYEANEATGR